MQENNNKLMVITGGSSGIGLCTAIRFAEEKYNVAVIDRNLLSSEILEQYDNIYFYKADITKFEELLRCFKNIRNNLGYIDTLIVNAGISIRHKFLDIEISEWNKVIDTNLNGSFYTVKASIDCLRKSKALILFTASTNGITGYPYYVDYNASKAGVISLAKSLALELSPNIRVNAVLPGYVLTPMQLEEYTEEMLEDVNNKIPLKRHAKPEEIANLFLFLSSSKAEFINGSQIIIDGGETVGGLASR